MNKRVVLVGALLATGLGYSQVGVGTLDPNKSAQLEVVADNKGVLIPQVALDSTLDKTTITSGNVNSLLVFNTATTNDVVPGYYYWYTDRWMRILNQKDINVEGNVVYNSVNNEFTYVDATGTTQVINLETIIKANETVTTLVNNGDGTYTYTNEAGDVVTIDVPADVINNFEEIINNTDFQTILNEYITNNVEGNVVYDSVSNQFTYVDATGTTQVINLETIIKANETVTTLVNNGDGTYTYTNEAGVEVIIDVPADVANNFQEIINNTDVQNILNQYITNNSANVSYDGSKFTYVDATGTTQVINLETIIKANETVTTLVNNGDGTYTYTNEAGDAVTIDVPADVVNNFQDIINRTEVQDILNQYITNNVEGNVVYDSVSNQFTYVDATGTTQVINLETIIKANETVTTLVNNGDGTYTYTNEAGDAVTIDVPADVVNNFQDIINRTEVQDILNQYITNNVEGNVVYDSVSNQFTYVDATGTTQVINLETIIKANETVTTLVNNGDGTYTYTNEAGDAVTIDVPADVVNNFQDIINRTEVQDILNQYITNNVEGNVVYDSVSNQFTYVDATGTTQVINLETIIKANETVTTLVNNGDGTYTYTNEAGDAVTIDVPADVANNFQEIINNTDVQNILNQYITNNGVGGNMVFDPNVTPPGFNYIDENGDLVPLNLRGLIGETVSTLVNNGDGTYTYTNEAGVTVTIDVPADVVNNFQDIINQTEVQDILNQYITNNVEGNVVYDSVNNEFTYVDATGTTQVIDLDALVKANETVTTLVNNGDGTYTYTNEAGIEVVIDVPADVVNNFQEIINKTEVQDILNQYITNEVEGNVSYDGNNFTYVDATGTTQVINLATTVVNSITNLTNEQTNVVKNNLGDTITNNSSVFTGDIYIDNGVTYYVYKGEFTTTITANTAITTGVTLDQDAHKILSINLSYGGGMTASVTDIALSSSTVGFRIGVGKTYMVINNVDTEAKVIIEFASNQKPDGIQ